MLGVDNTLHDTILTIIALGASIQLRTTKVPVSNCCAMTSVLLKIFFYHSVFFFHF